MNKPPMADEEGFAQLLREAEWVRDQTDAAIAAGMSPDLARAKALDAMRERITSGQGGAA